MKEEYFTPVSIETKAEAMLQSLSVWHLHKVSFTPQKSALLVLDMQEYFLRAESHAFVPSALAILPGLCALINVWKRQELPVIYTRHINTEENAAGMSSWWRELLRDEDPLAKISPVFDIKDCDVINKSQYDAFFGTTLESRLDALGVTQLVVSGVMTHLCCETTARSAFMRGFEVFFPVDGTATYNENYHRASLLNLAHGFATINLVNDLLTAQSMRGE